MSAKKKTWKRKASRNTHPWAPWKPDTRRNKRTLGHVGLIQIYIYIWIQMSVCVCEYCALRATSVRNYDCSILIRRRRASKHIVLRTACFWTVCRTIFCCYFFFFVCVCVKITNTHQPHHRQHVQSNPTLYNNTAPDSRFVEFRFW